uniref:Uncharacterized protein n=1 Tax=Podoviridae sp. ctzeq1 TaxID=2826597 RepID=A0A8S5M0C1_9CAUD|nr:MAG TPA: hypothetical protein [Podoviridae sp. ctzeq1]
MIGRPTAQNLCSIRRSYSLSVLYSSHRRSLIDNFLFMRCKS